MPMATPFTFRKHPAMAGPPSNSPHRPSRKSPDLAGWFYEIDGVTRGPVNFRALRGLANARKLLAHHLVWKSGSGDRQSASTILGLIPKPRKEAPSPPPSDLSDANPYATPKVRTIADGPPGGLYLPHLHPTNFLLYLATLAIPIAFFFLSRHTPTANTRTLLAALGGLSLLSWGTLSLIYLHRAWEMMRMFGASLTGGKAIRFLFIPFFNALWCFVALYGWSKLWNDNVSTHPGLKPAHKVLRPFFFVFPILFLMSQALFVMHVFIKEWPTNLYDQKHLASLGIWTATLGCTLICWGQLSQSINFLARKKC